MQIDWKSLFVSPNGRIGRQAFWIGFVIVLAVSFVLGMLGTAGKLLGFILIWPQIAIHAKRLHDIGRTAWLMLIPFLVTVGSFVLAAFVGGASLVTAMTTNDNAGMATMAGGGIAVLGLLAAPILAGIGFLLWVGLTPGKADTNRYGEAPL